MYLFTKEARMTSSRFFTVSVIVMASVIIAAGCKKTPTEDTYEPQLLLSQLAVSVVPDGTEEITVTATDENNRSQAFSVSCNDEGIATVTKTDSTIAVTGLTYGTANVKVRCAGGLVKTLPVKVYNPKVLETDELTIAFVDTFEYRWCSKGSSGQGTDGSFYHPVTTDWFHALGSLGFSGYSDPNGSSWIVVVKAKPGSDALKPPVDYEYVWDSRGTGADDEGSFWNPIPPAGYKALGTVAQRGYDKPSINDVVCIREDLTVDGALGGQFFWRVGTTEFASNLIDPPDAGPHDSCYLSTGTFWGAVVDTSGSGQPAVSVLSVILPMMAEAADQSFAPKLTGYDTPPDQTAPLTSREMSVPWSIVNDSRFDSLWRYAHSPSYRLERQVYYQLMYHNYNQTSQVQTNSVTLKSGSTTTESETFRTETGIQVSMDLGVSYMIFEAKVSATVSQQLGYEKQTSITELKGKEIFSSINTPPGKAAALWQKYNRFTLKRHNGTRLEPVRVWEFGIDSYVTDEYPRDK
jgi:hypothetical protein